jgi:hypothetical protein
MKMTGFWVVTACSLVENDRRFTLTNCLHHQGDDRPDDGGSKQWGPAWEIYIN